MYDNQFFLCTHHNLTAMETGSRLADGLKSLENGILMFDLKYKEEILVDAPLPFIVGDNVRQAEICCDKGARSTCSCRKFYWQLDPAQPRNRPVVPVHTSLTGYFAAPRLKKHVVMFGVERLPSLPEPGVTLRNRGRGIARNPNENVQVSETNWGKLGYKLTGGEVFFSLGVF